MLPDRLRLDQLRADDVPHRVRHKHRRRHDGLLGRARDITRPQRDDQTDHRPEEPRQRVPDHRRGGLIPPRGLPDERAPRDDGQTAGDEHGDAGVGHARGDVPAQRDEDDADPADGELK